MQSQQAVSKHGKMNIKHQWILCGDNHEHSSVYTWHATNHLHHILQRDYEDHPAKIHYYLVWKLHSNRLQGPAAGSEDS